MFGVYFSNQTVAKFKVTAHACNRGVLLALQSFFGCGRIAIDNRRDNTLKFVVTRQSDLLNKVIPHFQAFPLQGSKALNFLDFAEAVKLMVEGAHLTTAGLEQLRLLTLNKNKKRSYESKYNYLSAHKFIMNAEYVRGFVDGEGHFAVEINKPQEGRNHPTIGCSLQIAQASHDVLLLNSIMEYFGGTRIKPAFDIHSLIAAQGVRNVVRL